MQNLTIALDECEKICNHTFRRWYIQYTNYTTRKSSLYRGKVDIQAASKICETTTKARLAYVTLRNYKTARKVGWQPSRQKYHYMR
jgi:hypothetical protein